MVGGAVTTVKLAVAVFPAPPAELSVTLLTFVPTVVAVTFTLKLHELAAATVAPDSAILPLPGTAVIVPPPQDPVSPFGVDTTNPAGNVLVKAAVVSGPDPALVIV
jgi:hypothetical protein